MDATPTKTPFWNRKGFLYSIAILFGVVLVTSLVEDESLTSQPAATTPVVETTAAPQPTASERPKADAQAELDSLMSLSKKAGLISDYEFSASAVVVYADRAWYTQTVTFKKDFLAKIGLLKKEVTGYKHFEVRDSLTNEKVAEITSFNGSLEIYK